ncbi:MAG: hypothetical protein AABW54_00415 [Candidatus Micrarchaeota archaeon]
MALEDLIVTVFGAVLVASVVLFFLLHYYSQRARRHFALAEKRIEHAQKMLDDARGTVGKIRSGLKGKSGVRQTEEKISTAISDLLGALEEEKKAVRVRV